MIMRSKKGFIRPFVARPLSIRELEQEATLARESRQEVLSHSDILSIDQGKYPMTVDRDCNLTTLHSMYFRGSSRRKVTE